MKNISSGMLLILIIFKSIKFKSALKIPLIIDKMFNKTHLINFILPLMKCKYLNANNINGLCTNVIVFNN